MATVDFVAQKLRPGSRTPPGATTIKQADRINPLNGGVIKGEYLQPGQTARANMNYSGMGRGPHTTARPTFRTAGEYYAARDMIQGNPLDNLEMGNRYKVSAAMNNMRGGQQYRGMNPQAQAANAVMGIANAMGGGNAAAPYRFGDEPEGFGGYYGGASPVYGEAPFDPYQEELDAPYHSWNQAQYLPQAGTGGPTPMPYQSMLSQNQFYAGAGRPKAQIQYTLDPSALKARQDAFDSQRRLRMSPQERFPGQTITHYPRRGY